MVGNITNSKLLGGWTLVMQSAEKLPQPLASAFGKLFGDSKFGGSYTAEYYVATQPVNGINHMLIVERTKLISGGKTVKDFATVVINIPAGDIRGEKATIVSEKDATDFVLRDIEVGVKKALADYTGLSIVPLVEIGEQMVKGINYHFICESRINYTGAEPYLTRVAINNFQDNWTIAEIVKL